MGFLNRMKGVFSTGQASAVDEARRVHKGGDVAGAASLLKKVLEARTESGKALAVIRELHETFCNELNLKQLQGYRETLSASAFDLADYDRIDGIMTSLNRALRDNVYSGKARSEAEALYKEFHQRFQELRLDAQQKRQSEILKTLETTDPEKGADAYVTLVEELRGVGGRLPETMDADYRAAQERSYILPDNLKEFDNYVIERSLGRGGFASVFLASPKGVSFQAALKIFSPEPSLVHESGLSLSELKERFRREAGIMLRLSMEKIPGIVNARHTETWRGKPYLAMDYYPRNLSSLIGSDDDLLQTGRGGYLSFDKALPIITGILTSIHRLHTRKNPIIHRDLKPANILLDKDNRPYIGDFGLARETSRADLLSKAFQTATGTHLATQYYGAPEQRGGFKETDQRADVFSLGVIIYRMLTGRLIGFHDLEPIELYVQGLDKETAGRINDLLNKATRIEVDQRLADVSTLLEVFSPEQASVEISQAPTGPTAEHQFLSALEMAYSFAPDGKLPDNVRATLIGKSQELGIGRSEAELLEKDFRDRLGLSKATGGRVVSATAGAGLKTGEEKDVGTLVITSEPEMATVTVDGMERGKTPLTIDRIGAGNRTIRLKMDGFFPVSRIERILPDKETKIHVILEHQTGSINITARTFSDAYPARFYLDGKLMGRSPLTVQDITAGTHTYSLEADHHEKASGEIAVTLDEEVKISESLKPLPGIVTLRSAPPGAVIWVNGRKSNQKTDVRVKISAGKHAITLKLDSYVDATKELEILPSSVLEEQFRLTKNLGKINVASIPEGATIWVDGKDTEKKTDYLIELLPGEHEVRLRLDGYKSTNRKVSVAPEGFVGVEFRLERGVSKPLSVQIEVEETERDGVYIAYANGIVRDTRTGLEWVAGPDQYTNWSEANAWVENLSIDGGGWRMPTIDELESLCKEGESDQNMTPLLQINDWAFWSWTPWVPSADTERFSKSQAVSFVDGRGDWVEDDSYGGRVFAVRSTNRGFAEAEFLMEKGVSKPVSIKKEFDEIGRDGNYVAYANGIVRDTHTGLEWLAGPAGATSWNEAKVWVESVELAGGGWRMPTIHELAGLYNKWAEGDSNMTSLLKTDNCWVHSGETKGSSKGVSFNFFNGKQVWGSCDFRGIGQAFAVRSQRDGSTEAEFPPEKIGNQRALANKEFNEIRRDGIYVAYANGIVRDTYTGLEWLVGPDKDTTWDEAKSWVENLTIGGRGWRLPTMDELRGLYNEGTGDRNMTSLLKTSGWYVWAGVTMGSSVAGAFSFRYCSRGWSTRYDSYNARAFAVRSFKDVPNETEFRVEKGPNEKASVQKRVKEIGRDRNYVAYANGIVNDTSTGLEWLVGPDKDMRWHEAEDWVKNLNIGGGGWRMPFIDELKSLDNEGDGDRNMTPFLKTTGQWVWSGEAIGSSSCWDFAGAFAFINGFSGWKACFSSTNGRAFAVRSRNDG